MAKIRIRKDNTELPAHKPGDTLILTDGAKVTIEFTGVINSAWLWATLDRALRSATHSGRVQTMQTYKGAVLTEGRCRSNVKPSSKRSAPVLPPSGPASRR